MSKKETANPHPFTQALGKGQTPYHLCGETPEIATERVNIFDTYARIARAQVAELEKQKKQK